MLKNAWGMVDTDRQNSADISRPVSPRFATRFLCCNQSRELWWMNREWKLKWGAQTIRKWTRCMEHFVWYHTVTLASQEDSLLRYLPIHVWSPNWPDLYKVFQTTILYSSLNLSITSFCKLNVNIVEFNVCFHL